MLSDNAKCYSSKEFTELCDSKGIDQSFTRPYTPQTNGKAERFIQTMKRSFACGSAASGRQSAKSVHTRATARLRTEPVAP